MDPNNRSLNRLTANLTKAEALSAEIASISQTSGYGDKSLISCGEGPNLPGRAVLQQRPRIVGAVVQDKRAKRVKRPRRQRASTTRVPRQNTIAPYFHSFPAWHESEDPSDS